MLHKILRLFVFWVALILLSIPHHAFAASEELCVNIFKQGTADYFYQRRSTNTRMNFFRDVCQFDTSNTNVFADIVYNGTPITASYVNESKSTICEMSNYNYSKQIEIINSRSVKNAFVYKAFNECLRIFKSEYPLDYKVYRHTDVSRPQEVRELIDSSLGIPPEFENEKGTNPGNNLVVQIRWNVGVNNNAPKLNLVDSGSYYGCSLYDENFQEIDLSGPVNRRLKRVWYTLICERNSSSYDINPHITLFFSNLPEPLFVEGWPTRPEAPKWPIEVEYGGQDCLGGTISGRREYFLGNTPERVFAEHSSCLASCLITNDAEVIARVKNGRYGDHMGEITDRKRGVRVSHRVIGSPSGIPSYATGCAIRRRPDDATHLYRPRP